MGNANVYIEMSQMHFDEVESLFSRCLLRVLDLDLWRTYLKYVKIKHTGQKGEIEATQIAYDFVIKYMGHDINAYQVYHRHYHYQPLARMMYG